MRAVFITLFFSSFITKAQELFPNSEPASIIPKNVFGIRLMNEGYASSGIFKSWHGAMLMYGLNPKLMFTGMITASNHHYKVLPGDYVQKDSNEQQFVSQRILEKNNYLFEAINLGFRYRFLNLDGDHKHFRMAVYSNGVYALQPHDEAEISLVGDNKGVGGGLISTVLIKKLAISLTGGIIKPFSYKDRSSNITLSYGNAYNYGLSFGYLIYPSKYKNFKQTNINLYAEFIGKTYNALGVQQNQTSILINDDAHKGGSYVEARPAIQFIVKSNLRIDCSTAFPIVSRSYIRKYPLFLLNIQYYFFR